MTQASALVQTARRDGTGVSVAQPMLPTATPLFAREGLRVACVAIQFGLLVLLVRLLDIERGLLGDVLVVAWLGFLVHHYLPFRLRLPFFTLLSAASIL